MPQDSDSCGQAAYAQAAIPYRGVEVTKMLSMIPAESKAVTTINSTSLYMGISFC